MGIFLIIMCLFLLGAAAAKRKNERPETLLDCSDKLCKWNGGKPCPYRMIRYKGDNGFRRKVEGIHECCTTRQTRVRMAKLVLDGHIPTKGSQIIKGSRECFDRHKREHPEEHEFLFGEK